MLEIYKFDCFTTPCEIRLYCDNKTISDNCATKILKECKRLENKYNYFNKNSYLSKINKRITNKLDFETKFLFKQLKIYYKKTNGIFDITVSTMKNGNNKNYVGCDNFYIKKDFLYFTNDKTVIDLGGVIKEYSVDKAIGIIKKFKIASALVNFGGDIYALGKKPDNKPYSIGIKNPLNPTENLFSIKINNKALTTSASYERFKIVDGKKISHIISKTKNQNRILSATVVSSSCLNSGIYSTALMCDDRLDVPYEKYLIDTNLKVW